MENKIQIFHHEMFGDIRVIIENGKPLFCASDIAKPLGYARPNDAIKTHCRSTVKRRIATMQGNMAAMSFIPEGDIYRLCSNSHLPSSEKFESWVFDEVLPTIRKTGGYVNNDELFVNTYFSSVDSNTKVILTQLLHENRTMAETIEVQKPLVSFATDVQASQGDLLIRDVAKVLCSENINTGEKRLFAKLRDNNVLNWENVPYQQYIDRGYFNIVESVFKKNGKKYITKTPVCDT